MNCSYILKETKGSGFLCSSDILQVSVCRDLHTIMITVLTLISVKTPYSYRRTQSNCEKTHIVFPTCFLKFLNRIRRNQIKHCSSTALVF